METVILVLMTLVCFNYLLKQTCRKPLTVAISAVICALFTGLIWPLAIEQSRTQISAWLSDTALMLDISVILTIEVVLHLAFCIMAVRVWTSGELRRGVVRAYRVLRWFPGILIFVVLFCALVSAIFAHPGVSFRLVAWCLAIVVLVAIPLGTWLLRWLLPEKEIRIELLFLSNVLVAILGIISTVNGRTAVEAESSVDLAALAGVIVLIACGVIAGLLWRKWKLSRSFKNE